MNQKKSGKIPWNKRSPEEMENIKQVLKKTLSIKKAAKMLGLTPSALATINCKHFKINCQPGRLNHPKWTKEEDEFAIKYLKKNPDLRDLAKIIAEKRGIPHTKQFQHNVRERSAEIWKLNLKKRRAKKGLTKNLISKGSIPWNKKKTKYTDKRLMKISKNNTGHKHKPETISKLEKIAQERAKNLEWQKSVSKTQFKKGEISPYSVAIFITKKCPICRKFIRVPLPRANTKYHKRCFYESDEFKKAPDKNKTIEYRKIVSERYNDPNFLYKWYKGILFKNIPGSQLTDLDIKVIKAKVLIHKIRRSLNESKQEIRKFSGRELRQN